MTRVNVVPVEELCDEHLRAEWREITRIPNKLKNGRLKYNLYKVPSFLPYKNDVTGKPATGHEHFFTDKLKWLNERYQLVLEECHKRGFVNCVDNWPNVVFPDYQWMDWEPCDYEFSENRRRIKERWPTNPHFYGEVWL